MNQTISMAEAKNKLSELVGQVKYSGQRYILERSGQPMAILISLEEYEGLQSDAETKVIQPLSPIPAELQQHQQTLVKQAHQLEQRLGDPITGLANLFIQLPRQEDEFWLEIQEVW